MSRLSILVLSLSLTGCEHARSFLQMDSNSSSPFLGLQLSVDAGSGNSRGAVTRQERLSVIPVSRVPSAQGNISDAEVVTIPVRDADFVPTSDSFRQPGTIRYSLPAIDLTNHSDMAAEVDNILDRMAK